MPRRSGGTRINIRLNAQLVEWAKSYAKRRGTDLTKLIREYFIALKAHDERQEAEAEQI